MKSVICKPESLRSHRRYEIMITPYASGDTLRPCRPPAERQEALAEEALALPSLLLESAAAANAVMLGAGYFHPLEGYMTIADAMSIAADMHTRSGLFWPVPCLNLTTDKPPVSDRLTLLDPNSEGHPPLAVQQVENVAVLSDQDREKLAQGIFGTLDRNHPGVNSFLSQGRYVISGPISVINYSYFAKDFPDTFQTAVQIREDIAAMGWRKVVAFQTRNPMHRAHEELCKMAKEAVDADGILIHMLLGKLKEGDIPADVRDDAIRAIVKHYFPPNSVLVSGYGFDMLYAGPREALLHAIFRQNAGCDYLIVGRDHAGVGQFYTPFEAQEIFDRVPEDALRIRVFKADHTAYSKKLGRVVMMRDAPDHAPEDYVLLSGTRVREMLAAGEPLPEEFARPEVAAILGEYYRREASQT